MKVWRQSLAVAGESLTGSTADPEDLPGNPHLTRGNHVTKLDLIAQIG